MLRNQVLAGVRTIGRTAPATCSFSKRASSVAGTCVRSRSCGCESPTRCATSFEPASLEEGSPPLSAKNTNVSQIAEMGVFTTLTRAPACFHTRITKGVASLWCFSCIAANRTSTRVYESASQRTIRQHGVLVCIAEYDNMSTCVLSCIAKDINTCTLVCTTKDKPSTRGGHGLPMTRHQHMVYESCVATDTILNRQRQMSCLRVR